jgi:ceramide glucosyltransferase
VLGQAVRRQGLAVELSPYLVDDIVDEDSLAGLFRHELRWARTIRLVAPWGFLGSAVTNPVPLALLALASGALPRAALVVLALALACRLATAWRLDRALRLNHLSWWLLPVRDLLSFVVFIASFLGQLIADGQSPYMTGRPV